MVLLMVLVGFLGVMSNNFAKRYITGKAIDNFQYSYTKAICNETNYCQDYVIVCKGDKIVSQTPVTGAFLQQAPDWEDPRDAKTINNIC